MRMYRGQAGTQLNSPHYVHESKVSEEPIMIISINSKVKHHKMKGEKGLYRYKSEAH